MQLICIFVKVHTKCKFSQVTAHMSVIEKCRLINVNSGAELFACFIFFTFYCYLIKQLLTIEAFDMM